MKKLILKYLILIISLFILFLSIYIVNRFNSVSFEQLLHSIFTSKGTSYDSIITGGIYISICIIVSLSIILIVKKVLNKLYEKKLISKNKYIYNIALVIFSISSVLIALNLLNMTEYIYTQTKESNLIKEYYVDPKDVNMTFPEEKKNLIYIYVESLEMSAASVKSGGALDKSIIPNLEKLALNNTNFSNTENLGGALAITGTTWTAAAMISHTSGIPLKLPISFEDYDLTFPNIYNLGDILSENGYKNYLMIGSNAEFGARKDYFVKHGNYKIYDYVYAKEKGLIDKNYFEWWGYEDKKLFEFAKDKLTTISKKDEPFNFTMLTADTHFTDGYLDSSCDEIFDEQYKNVFYCSDSMVYKFIKWIEKQDFYKDTVIIITGDHLTMQSDLYENISSDYDRNIYNVFINSEVKPKKDKERLFTTYDMFPTTLAALGAKIKDNKLGLGVNLYSNKETIIEKLGYEYVNEELKKHSKFYNNKLLR